jgi:hypothetical protein
MLRLFSFAFRSIFRLKVVLLSMAAGAAITSGLHVREQSRSWGILPGDAERELPGDDLVPAPGLVETRSLVIAAPPTQVWPWLVQMGYGRGGWYSFTPLDRPWRPGGAPGQSATAILPEFQELSVGDVVPTQPSGGFVVKVVEPERALVLYLDDEMVRAQVEEQAVGRPGSRGPGARDTEMPAFGVSWAFVLEAEPGGGTRLVERVRARIDLTAAQRRGMPMLGMGLFALLRSQMTGIKRRAEGPTGRAA